MKLPLIIMAASMFVMAGVPNRQDEIQPEAGGSDTEDEILSYPYPPLGEVFLQRKVLWPSWMTNLKLTIPREASPENYVNAIGLIAQGLDGLKILVEYLEICKEGYSVFSHLTPVIEPIINDIEGFLTGPIHFNVKTQHLMPDLRKNLKMINDILGTNGLDEMLKQLNIKLNPCVGIIVPQEHQIYRKYLTMLSNALAEQIIRFLWIHDIVSTETPFGSALERYFKYYDSRISSIGADLEKTIWTVVDRTPVGGFAIKCHNLTEPRAIGIIRFKIGKFQKCLIQARAGAETLYASLICMLGQNPTNQEALEKIIPEAHKLTQAQLKLCQNWIRSDTTEPSFMCGYLILPDQSVISQEIYGEMIKSGILKSKEQLELLSEESHEDFEVQTGMRVPELIDLLAKVISQPERESPLNGLENELYTKLLWLKQLGDFKENIK